MDGRPHNRKSSYARSQTGSTSAPSPASAKSPNGSRGRQKQDDQTLSLELKNLDLPSNIAVCRRSSVRRGSSSSINPPDPSPVPGPAPANPANDDDQSLSRQGSQKPDDQPLSRQGSQKQEDQPLFVELDSTVCHRSSAIEFLLAPIIQYLSPEQLSDETVIPEVETTNFHPDTRDESLPRHQSLSAHSQRSSSSAGNPDDQSLSRQGSQKQDDQPLSLELDPLELPSTSTVRRPSSAAEVLLGSILQYLSSEPPSDESIIPEVETTENHTETRDESPPRHKSLSAHSRKSSSSAGNSDNQPLSCRGNQKPDNQPLSLELDPLELPSTSTVRRPSSAAEVLLGSVLQYISSEPSSDEPVVPKVETTENHIKARDESLPRHKSLSSSSHWSLSSAVARVLETAEDLSPEQGSDEAIILEVEGIEYYSDTRDMSPPRRKSLSTRSRRSSSSAVAPEVETSEGLRPEEVSGEVNALEVESTEYYSDARDVSPSRRKSLSAGSNRSSSSAGNLGYQSFSRRGSQKPFNQPLSLELDPLELPSTSTVHRPSSAAEVLLGSILQYLSPEQLSDETVIPEVETTNFHPDTRDESLPRHQSLSARSKRSSSSAGNPDDQSLSRRGSQKQDDQPLFLELDPLELPSTSTVRRPSSAAEVLLGSILQYLSSEPSSNESIIPEVETTENHTEIRDESPPRHKSLSTHSRKSLSSAGNSDDQLLSRRGSQKPDDQPLSRRGNQKPDNQPLSLELDPLELPSTSTVRRSSSAAEVLLGSVLQYINSEPSSDEPFVPKVETTENHIKARVDSLPRLNGLSSSSHLSLSSAVAPVVEITEDLSPEQGSDEAVALEVESIEYYSDTRDMSPPRCKSLSARSRWSSSSVVATEVESTEYYSDARDESPSRRKSLSAHSRRSSSNAGNPDDQPLSNRGSQKPDDQPLSRWGSQKPDDQPLSLELDPLELPSTSTVRRPSSAAEVLLGSILQYISSEPPLEEPFVPEVDNTENTEVRDESPPRCKSLSVRSRRSSSSAGNSSNVCQGSQMRNDQPLSVEFDILDISSTSALRRRSLAPEVILGPILQYLSSEPPSDETIIPKVETTENQTEARDESPPRHKSLFARSRWSSYCASAPEVETTEDQSPEKVSDEAVALEGESTEYYSDARDVSPSRSNSLSAGSHRSSSSAGNLDVQPLSRRGSQMPDDQPLSRRGSQKPDDQPLSRWGSQKPDDQPLSLELDPLELPSTSTVRRPSSAAEVLLGSILQYISSEPPLEEPVVPEVDNTENTEVRDESPPRCKSLSVHSRRSSSSAGNPSNVHQGSQMRNDQPLSVEFDILDISSTSALRRRSLAAEVLLGPILQYLSSEPSSDETVIPEVETTEKNAQLRDESPPRRQSLSPRSRRSSSSAVVPEVETTEYCSDKGDGSPLRRRSLSIRSRRSSSSGGNAPSPRLTPDNTHNGLQGSQMQDNLDELDTSAVRRRSWAVEVLLDPILQYLNPGHSEKADIEESEIPAVEATEH
ncbi:serine/arginine repetitive matrix protein 2-like [Oncorhynchus tshawytscha]|uniref:serine/arginine repetitive matrix protein 2-like n=1 Tax=Oncorhynchus tshawytscha TaxID=74940 RepID=UPI001C3C2BB4|nr:serine/arginine repetitive matrix protein 2-like [Oncorhynchus tshawytscha]